MKNKGRKNNPKLTGLIEYQQCGINYRVSFKGMDFEQIADRMKKYVWAYVPNINTITEFKIEEIEF